MISILLMVKYGLVGFPKMKLVFGHAYLPHILQKILVSYQLQIFMYYNNILWLMGDKTALCVRDLCFGELDCLVVSVLQWPMFM